MATDHSHQWGEVSRKTMRDGTVWVYEQCTWPGCSEMRSRTE